MSTSRLPPEFLIPLITAIMAFAGSILGAYLVAELDQSNWEERFKVEQRKTIIDKRIELIERTSFMFSKSSLMEALEANIQGAIDIINIERECLASGASADTCIEDKDNNLAERLGKERYAINSELLSTLTLSSIYFGPKTKEALRIIIKAPWKSSAQDRQVLINAMGNELNYFESDL